MPRVPQRLAAEMKTDIAPTSAVQAVAAAGPADRERANQTEQTEQPPSDTERRKLRNQARSWLQAELARWAKLLETANEQQRAFIAATLKHWLQDPDLIGVRDTSALDALPDGERQQWRSLWDDVRNLLKRAASEPHPHDGRIMPNGTDAFALTLRPNRVPAMVGVTGLARPIRAKSALVFHARRIHILLAEDRPDDERIMFRRRHSNPQLRTTEETVMFLQSRTRSGIAAAARNRRRPQVELIEDRCLLSGISGYTTYPVPSGNAAFYLTTGSDGNVWFTEGNASKVAMMNAKTHAVSEFATPTANSFPREITTGPDGNIWFTEYIGNKLGMVNITTHAITEYTVSATRGYQPWGITVGPDHNIWFTGKGSNATGVIGVFNPTTHAFSLFPTPTNGAGPQGITVGSDGNLWFTESAAGKIGEINPTTHSISEFVIPAQQTDPSEIATGTDGNLWFAQYYDGDGGPGIGSINPTTQAFNLFTTVNIPTGITTGPDGDVWFGGSQLGTVNLTNDAVTQFSIPAGRGLMTGPDGNLWLPSGASIIVATVSSTQNDLVVTQQPPASVTAGSSFGLTVTAEDGSGNVLTSFNGTVTVALGNNPGGGTLGGTLTTTAVNGVATFSGLTLTMAGSGYTLVTSSGLYAEGITSVFEVTPASATQLVITQQPPSSVKAGTAFALVAAIEDSYGNIVTTANNEVSVAIASNPGGATLGGTTTVQAVNGIVTFSNLSLNKKGKGYTLKLTSSGLTGATTSAIQVT